MNDNCKYNFHGDKVCYDDNGKFHCLNGPAIITIRGGKQWWINGKQLSEKEHTKISRQIKIKDLKNEFY